MLTVLLVRHGESQSNAGLATSDPMQVELIDKGWEQAGDIAEFLNGSYCPDLIVTSAYERTKQTARPTTRVFSFVPVEEWPVHEFTYLSMWHEHLSTTNDRQQAVDAYWQIADPAYVDNTKTEATKVESFQQFIDRVREVKHRLEQSELDTIVVFTHEQFITAFVWLAQQDRLPDEVTSEMMKEFRAGLLAHPLPNGAIVRAEFHQEYEGWSCKRIVSHLKEGEAVSAHAMV